MTFNFKESSITTIIQDFTGVYAEQPFMQGLRKTGGIFLDCTKIEGTDCYCDDEAQAELNKIMNNAVEAASSGNLGIHFFDNGNYHYMSKLWTDRVQEPFDLVIFDHHPDMQPPRFEGILSCGGWVKEVLEQNKFVQNILLIGVADHLVDEIREALSQTDNEHILGRVQFIKESELRSLQDKILNSEFRNQNYPIYISIDKDALSTNEAATNWDQGSLTYEQLAETLRNLAESRKILAIDICGERARDMGFEDTAAADALNNALNEKLFHTLVGLHGIQ